MTKKITIAIDAMGGENAPKKNIEALNIFLKKNKSKKDFVIHLYGNKEVLDQEILKLNIKDDIISSGRPLQLKRSINNIIENSIRYAKK